MPRTHAPSIAAKLTAMNTIIAGAALLLASLAFGLYDRTTYRDTAMGRLSVQAQIVASNSVSALLFDDPHAAEMTLSALRAAPNIESAEIDTADGRVFATYRRGPGDQRPSLLAIPEGQAEAARIDDRQMALTRRIVFQGKPAGSVSINADVQDLISRRNRYIGIIATVLTASLVVAWLLSWLAQRAISRPLAALAAIARRVSGEKNYATRADLAGNTEEIVVLVEAFNDMLSHIQSRDQSLLAAHEALEERVRQRTAELDAVNKELEAFSYSVSHDLRAPLRHVTGFAGLLESHAHAQLDDQGRKYLRTIAAAASRMGQLIDDLLSFSRMGRDPLSMRRVSMAAVVEDARQEVMSAVEVAGRAIEWRIGELPDVEGDPAMLRLVLVNLLSNAVKYTGPRAPARIEVGTTVDEAGAQVFFVKDNGVGFDMKYVHKLFGVFQRLHAAEEFEGTGIGLANVRRILHRHGGAVWAESAVDQGATFWFSLKTIARISRSSATTWIR